MGTAVNLNTNYQQEQISGYKGPRPTGSTNSSLFASDKGNTCTDGKDDGKIGLFSAVGNIIDGVEKTAVNAVKGLVTNEKGEFSLGKTLWSGVKIAATAALCAAYPPAGIALCTLGAVKGVVSVGSGVVKACNATTDKEAKEAWEQIGGGAAITAISVYGAKTGVKSMTSQIESAGQTSLLNTLEEGATIGQKVSALGKDMLTSTKVSANNIATVGKAVQLNGLRSKTELTDAQFEKVLELRGQENVLKTADKISDYTSNIKASGSFSKEALELSKLSRTKNLSSEQLSRMEELMAKDSLVEAADKISSYSISNMTKTAVNSIKKINIGDAVKSLPKNLQTTGQSILSFIKQGGGSYEEACTIYGQTTVDAVLESISISYIDSNL